MKQMIIDIDELSDSRELMESKEAPGIRWFIFILFFTILFFFVFSYYFYIDEYSKENFEVKTDSVESEVILSSSSKVSKVFIREGDYVEKGAPLFSFNVEYAKKQKEILEKELEKKQFEINKLDLLKKSIEKDENLFSNSADDSEYYYRFEQYKNGVLLTKDDIEKAQKSSNASSSEKKNSIESANQNINKNTDKIAEYKNLLECIKNDEPYNGNDSTVASYYQNYKSEYDKGVNAVNAAELEYNNYKELFTNQNEQKWITPSQVQEAENKMKTASGNINIYKESFVSKINIIIQSLNSDEDAEIINEYLQLIEKVKLDESFNSSYQEVQKQYEEYNKMYSEYNKMYEIASSEYSKIYDEYVFQSKQSIVSKEDVDKFEGIYNNAKSSLETIKSSMIYDIELKIQELESEDDSLNSSISSLNSQLSGIKDYDNTEELSVEKLKNDSIIEINKEVKSIENNLSSFETQIADLDKTISDSNICASCSGEVTLMSDIYEGDLIQAGTILCKIIPTDDELKARIYINEKDIPGIKIGHKVEYSVNSFPIEEYGTITGHINSISADTVTDEKSGTRYYIAEADFDKIKCKNRNGEERSLKNGMLGEVKILSGEKTLFIWLMEKLNFVD